MNVAGSLVLYMGAGSRQENLNPDVDEVQPENGNDGKALLAARRLNRISLMVFPPAFILSNVIFFVILNMHEELKESL